MGSAVEITSTGDLEFQEAAAVDWNGDGLQDIVVPDSVTGTWWYILSTGDGFDSPVDSYLSSGTPSYGFRTDSDGDGLEDIAYVKSDGKYVYRSHSGVVADLLDTVTDGNFNTTTFSYAPLTDSSVYTKHSDAVFPQQDFQSGMQVVSSIEQSDGIGSTFIVDYSYAGAQRNVEGRGLSGFATRTTIDNRNGNNIEESYDRDFPYIGTLTNRKMRLSDTTLIQDTTFTWQKKSGGSGFEDYHYPYLSQIVGKTFEAEGTYNGNQVNQITVTNIVDSYGTVTDSTTTTVESSSANGAQSGASYTQRTLLTSLTNSTSTWCLGNPGRIQNISSHSGTYGTQITRTTDLTWDTTSNCRLDTIVVEPDVVHSGNSTYQVTTALGYDSFGNVNSQTVTGKSMAGRTTTTNWGTYGQVPNTVTNALSQATTYGWDYETGNLLSVTDANGIVTSWLYDEYGRRTRETRPDGTYTEFSLSDCKSANNYCSTYFASIKTKVHASSKGASNSEIRYDDTYLDTMDRMVQSSQQSLSGGASNRRIHFDAMGRVSRRYTPSFAMTPVDYEEVDYDLLSRPKDISREVDDENATIQHTLIFYEGLTRRVVDAEGNESKTVNNALGRVYRSIDDGGYYQQFELDAFGSLRRTKDSLTNVLNEATFAYGAGAFRESSNDMDFGNGWTYSPNALGEVTAYSDAKSQSFSATFDSLGRPLTRLETEGTTTWTWGTSAAANNIGKLQSVAGPGHSQSYLYDSDGRLSKHTTVSDTTYDIDYGYDSTTGLLGSVEYPLSDGTFRLKVLRDYQFGLLEQVERSDTSTVYWKAQSENAFGQVIDEDFGNGVTTVRGSDGITGRLDYIQSGVGGGNTLQDFEYLWDNVGNLTQRKDVNRSLDEDFNYDGLNRLDNSELNSVANLDMSYDAMGNIQVKDDVSSSTWTYHASKKHAVITAGSNSYAYDNNGNMTTRNGDSITWTSYNYPTAIDDGSKTFEYSYDANRQRWKQVYDNGTESESTYYVGGIFEKNVNDDNGDIVYRHYIHARGNSIAIHIRPDGGTAYDRYNLRNHQGSVAALLDGSGISTVDENFSAFGERRDPADWVGEPSAGDRSVIADTTDHGYTDHISLEESSLVHMNGRVYDAAIGRFLSPDPIVQSPTSTQSWNRYSYVFNSPLSFTDPSGFDCVTVTTGSRDVKGGETVEHEACWGMTKRELEAITTMINAFAAQTWGVGPLSVGNVEVDPGRIEDNPDVKFECVGQARVLEGNPALIGLPGGFTGTTVGNILVTANSIAVIANQFAQPPSNAKGNLRPYIDGVSGSTAGGQSFSSIRDIIGNNTVANVRTMFVNTYPGVLILELVSGVDEGITGISMMVPTELGCPTGTTVQ